MSKKDKHSPKQKAEAVLRLLRREEPTATLARRYGVAEGTLYRWREEFIRAGQAALADGKAASNGKSRRIKELEREVADRDQVVGELTIANRILKKASEGLL